MLPLEGPERLNGDAVCWFRWGDILIFFKSGQTFDNLDRIWLNGPENKEDEMEKLSDCALIPWQSAVISEGIPHLSAKFHELSKSSKFSRNFHRGSARMLSGTSGTVASIAR